MHKIFIKFPYSRIHLLCISVNWIMTAPIDAVLERLMFCHEQVLLTHRKSAQYNIMYLKYSSTYV